MSSRAYGIRAERKTYDGGACAEILDRASAGTGGLAAMKVRQDFVYAG